MMPESQNWARLDWVVKYGPLGGGCSTESYYKSFARGQSGFRQIMGSGASVPLALGVGEVQEGAMLVRSSSSDCVSTTALLKPVMETSGAVSVSSGIAAAALVTLGVPAGALTAPEATARTLK